MQYVTGSAPIRLIQEGKWTPFVTFRSVAFSSKAQYRLARPSHEVS